MAHPNVLRFHNKCTKTYHQSYQPHQYDIFSLIFLIVLLLSENFDCETIPKLTTNLSFIEIVTVKIKFFNKHFVVSSIYRPPKTNFELFNTFIGDAFTSDSLQNCDKIICGDFNLNLMNMTDASNNSSVFHNNMQTLALLPVISKPTRISPSSCSLIDNIFVNNLVNFRSGFFTIDISDHMLTFIIYK